LTLSSRAFYNDVFPRFAEFVTKTFGFDMVLPMNTGAEAVETAIKIARKWGYKVKGIPHDKALVFSVKENFHGRTASTGIRVKRSNSNNFIVCCYFHVD
jgi:ornithine--oxo-acid transaminase